MRNKILPLIAVLATAFNVSAYDFSAVNCDGLTIYYNITSTGADKTCEVTKSPVSDDYTQDITIPAQATYRGTTYKVTGIGQNAFSECYELTSIAIPETVTSIADYAFESCTFMESVELPNSLISIGTEAFASCTSLLSVTIPDNVTSLGNCVFNGCYRLESFAGRLASADGRCLIVDGVLNSFARAGLTSYDIPDYVTAIGNNAFSDCNQLTSVTIPDKVTSIGNDAFMCCYGLTSIALPSALKTIGNEAFGGCPFTSLTIPNSVTTIGDDAFSCCGEIKSVVIPNSVTSIGASAFDMCDSLTSVVIGNSVTSIGNSAFKKCPNLKSFTGKFATDDGRCLVVDGVLNSFAPAGLTSFEIPNTVTSIGYGVFWDCTRLTSLTIPDSVTSIGDEALGCCSGLLSLTIPASVKSIGTPGFAGCSNLKAIIFMSATPPTVQYDGYANAPTDTCILIVPTESAVQAYKTADYWSNFKNIVSANAQ